MPRGLPVTILTAVLCLAQAGAAWAQDRPGASYKSLIDEGLSEFELGNWSEALALFSEAHKAQPNARTLRAVGMTLFELRRYVEAIDYLERALEDKRKPLDAEQGRSVRELLERAQRFVGTVKIETQPENVRVLVDGKEEQKREVVLDVGDHKFTGEADGYEPYTITVAVRPAETQSVSLVLSATGTNTVASIPTAEPESETEPIRAPEREPEPEAQPSENVLPWILIGAGGALAVGGTITGVLARNDYNTLKDDCPGRVCDPDKEDTIDRGRVLQTLTNVLWAVGGATIGAGVVLMILDTGETESSEVAFTPACGGDGCGLVMNGGF